MTAGASLEECHCYHGEMGDKADEILLIKAYTQGNCGKCLFAIA